MNKRLFLQVTWWADMIGSCREKKSTGGKTDLNLIMETEWNAPGILPHWFYYAINSMCQRLHMPLPVCLISSFLSLCRHPPPPHHNIPSLLLFIYFSSITLIYLLQFKLIIDHSRHHMVLRHKDGWRVCVSSLSLSTIIQAHTHTSHEEQQSPWLNSHEHVGLLAPHISSLHVI